MTHDEIVPACLEREIAARQSDSPEILVLAYRFSARDFDLEHRRNFQRDTA